MKLEEIQYQEAIDWPHCEDLMEATKKFSEITRILNLLTMVTKKAEMELILKIADHGEEIDHKLSRDNKMIRLLVLEAENIKTRELFMVYREGKSAIAQVRMKREAIQEDINSLKKIEGWRPNQ